MKRAAVYLSAVIMLAAAFLCISPNRLLAADNSLMLNDFTKNTGEWVAGDNTRETVVGFYDFGDGDVRECLEVVSYNLTVRLLRSVRAEFNEPLDLTEYRKFSYDIYALPFEPDPFAEYYTRVVLYAEDGSSAENIVQINSGEWNTVSVDLGTWSGRDNIVSAEISLTLLTESNESHTNSFFIDNITAGDRINRELTDRFMFDVFRIEGGQAAYSAANDRLTIRLSPAAVTTLKATVFVPEVDWSFNCLRIKLDNSSDLETMVLHYSTYDTAVVSEDKSIIVELDKPADNGYYYIDVGDVSKLCSIMMQFDGGNGTIEIESICALSVYRPEQYETCGSVAECRITDDLGSVHFTGEVTRDEVLANQTGSIAIYFADYGSGPDLDALAYEEPLLTSPMTTKFDLTLDIGRLPIQVQYGWFIVVSKRADGSLSLIAPPICVNNPEKLAPDSKSPDYGVKGVVSQDISLVGEASADRTILEIDAGRAFADKNGERYIFGGEAYYFDRDYFDSLDGSISALRGSGVGLIFRLTGWSEALEAALAEEYAASGGSDPTVYTTVEDGDSYLAAFCSYIAERWCGDGSVCGIIWGNCLNLPDRFAGETFSLNHMIILDSVNLRTVYNSFVTVNPGLRIYASVTDMYSAGLGSAAGEIGLDEYLPALIAEISTHGQFDFGVCVEVFYRIGEVAGTRTGADSCDDLLTLLQGAGADSRLIFCDSTYSFPNLRLGDLLQRLALGYYNACFNPRIDAYIAALPDSQGSEQLFTYLSLIDTDDADEINSLALSMLKISDWKEVIDGYNAKQLTTKQRTGTSASYDEPSGIMGRFSYYSFDALSGVSDFDRGYYCTGITIKGGGEATLRARLDPSAYGLAKCAYMGISQSFEYPENLTLTPVLAVTLGLNEVTPSGIGEVPVKVVLLSGGDRFEASALLTPGEMKTIYVDVSDFPGAYNCDGIQLLADGSGLRSATLVLAGIDGLSTEYNDESLESVIADERIRRRSENPSQNYGKYIWIGGGILVVVATVLTVVLLSRKKEQSSDE